MTRRCSPVYVLAVRTCMPVKGAKMTFRKSARPADPGRRTGALWTADSGRAGAETELRGPWDVVGRRS
jgi:hypothetical protein